MNYQITETRLEKISFSEDKTKITVDVTITAIGINKINTRFPISVGYTLVDIPLSLGNTLYDEIINQATTLFIAKYPTE